MSDGYDAIYAATLSRIGHVDARGAIYDAVAQAMQGADYLWPRIQQEATIALGEMQRPSVLYRPTLTRDGNMWWAHYGDHFPEGVSGFGETPAAAMRAFDEAWLSSNAAPSAGGGDE